MAARAMGPATTALLNDRLAEIAAAEAAGDVGTISDLGNRYARTIARSVIERRPVHEIDRRCFAAADAAKLRLLYM